MILARHEAAPLRFLLAIVIGWAAVRGVVLIGWRPDGTAARLAPYPALLGGSPASAGPLAPPPGEAGPRSRVRGAFRVLAAASGGQIGKGPRPSVPVVVFPDRPRPSRTRREVVGPRQPARPQQAAVDAPIGTPEIAAAPARWSGSAWLLLRDGGGAAPPLAPVGRIGGGQAGARLLYRIDRAGRLAASARVSRSIGGPRQTEAAVGIDWSPLRGLHLTAERRVAIDRGGRDAFAIGAAGGIYALPIARGWRLDGYAEAGVVGASRRDVYGDGAIRIGRELPLGDATLTLGGGAWGAAQPGARRLDIGPSAVLRLPAAGHTVAVALDWRERVGGDARPGSGPALTLGIDF